jgi:hypothetical protein
MGHVRGRAIARRSLASRLASVVAGSVAVVLGAGLLGPAPAAAEDTVTEAALPEIIRSVSDAGFVHPGVGLTADHIENMRTQVLAGVEPWASYYDAMVQTRYAAVGFKASIQGPTDDEPTVDAYNTASMRGRQHADSIGAMTQALMYVVTGDEVYRANALHVIRTWSSLDPDKYQYFADAHIHTGVPLYQTLVAAEIIRSTEPVNDELDGYDLRWSERDQQRIEDNLIRPVLDTFLYSQNRLWNQHLYGVIGMVAAAIFLDDAELYAERVEWFTVNASYESEHTINGGDVNGSLAAIIRTIDKDDPLNTYGAEFVQVMEMGRDQAHAEGDIDLLTALARVVDNQGTRVDPVSGTVSTAPDAVTPYEFMDNRILTGGDLFAAFMMGEDLPWVDTSGGSGKIAEGYRGRLREPLNELYYQYKYVGGVDVEKEAPYVAEQFEHRDGPLFYYGSGVSNFWNESGSDFTGAEYWVAFPPELAEQDVTVPAAGDGPELPLEKFGHTLGQGAKHKVDDAGAAFVRLDANKADAEVAVRRVVWADRASTALVGVRVRTNGTARLEVARTSSAEPFTTVQLPDTHGRWRYVSFDVDSAKVPSVGDHIVFLRATGGNTNVDVAAVLANANGTLTPPVFDDGASLDVVAVAGEPYTRALGVSDSAGDHVSLELQGAPKGVELSDDGRLTWLPGEKDRAAHDLVVVASDGLTDTALPVTITVAQDRPAAIDALLAGLDEPSSYTTRTWQPLVEAREAVSAAAEDAGPAEFADLLEDLRLRIEDLKLLDPRLADGTLDFSRLVTSPDLSSTSLAILVDNDNQTFWGDIRRPSVLLDFGAGYRFRADAFGWLARDTFPDRSHGANAYGSNDGSSWTLLTEHVTEGDDVAIETVAVREKVRDSRFRYLKLQVDEPQGPGIFSMADLRIHGERTEATLDELLALARDGEDLSAYSRASVVLFEREVEAVGAAADDPDADSKVLALRLLEAWELLEEPPYETVDVRQEWVTASSQSWDGKRDAAGNGWAMFDGDLSTFTDTTSSSGWVTVVPDDGSGLTVAGVRYAPRSGHVARAEGVEFQGSTDGGQTWTTFATISGAAAGWNRIDLEAPVQAGAVRVLASSGNTNLAEVELISSTLDRSALALYLTETAELSEGDWTPESWAELVDARATAQEVLRDAGADQAAVDAAADGLAAAVAGLEPAAG